MAHLWALAPNETGDREWCLLPLKVDAYNMTTSPPSPLTGLVADAAHDLRVAGGSDVRADSDMKRAPSRALLRRCRSRGSEDWLLLVNPHTDVHVNGHAVPARIRMLASCDEIRVGDATFFFSSEELPRKVAFPGSDKPVFCPRCLQEVATEGETGEPILAVCCPSCEVWYHETRELGCWTYSDTCMTCTQPTDLSSGFQWTPEAL